jgi:hypothetical protein
LMGQEVTVRAFLSIAGACVWSCAPGCCCAAGSHGVCLRCLLCVLC